jgi:trehalose-phosphatase
MNKGVAINKILNEGNSDIPIAYLGDDLTDEDAFRAIGNNGLRVLVRKQTRTTLADIQIIPPGELLKFLDMWIESTSSNL